LLAHLTIYSFRSFRELRIDPLTRVNLFVGPNNAGKSSILEACELVAGGTAAELLRSPVRRGERVLVGREERGRVAEPEWDLSHLFYGHSPQIGDAFRIHGGTHHWVQCEVIEAPARDYDIEQKQLLPVEPAEPVPALAFKSHSEERIIRVSPHGGMPDLVRRRGILSPTEAGPRVNFIGTEMAAAFQLSQLWDEIVLTPEEQGIVKTLQIVEPSIERIAFIGEAARRNIFLKPTGTDQRLPLGSAGDGLKRLLALALHLFSARGGFLMVDEIDTGLHYTVMTDMWRLVIETAKRLDVQVLATTHSLDCVRALAWVREENPESAGEVTLHRVERERPQTVTYTMDELAVAARSHIEVR
jgi:energy-coupling factor transporter ATP-binding protein EcfA2